MHSQRLYQVHSPNFSYYAKRTEIPFYSDRLNKRIQDYTLSNRIIEFFQNNSQHDAEYAYNTLLTKSYQGKLNLSAILNKEFNLNNYINITLLDALMRSIAELVPIQNNEQSTFKLQIKPNNHENIKKVIGIIRNSILQAGNDQIIASNPTVIEVLIELSHNYYSFRRSLSASLGPIQGIKTNKYQITSNSNTPQYIMEILSKTISKVTSFYDNNSNDINNNNNFNAQQLHDSDLIYTNSRKVVLGNGIQEGWILSSTRNDTVIRAIQVIQMSIYTFDNDDELLASLETLEQVLLSARTRILIKDSILKPIYDQFIIENNNQIKENSDSTPTTTTTSKTYQVNFELAKEILENTPSIIGRLNELLGHLQYSIQLSTLNNLIRLSKSSHKSRIMIANYPGIIRNLLNLLSLKSGENFEIGKRAAHLLFNFSKETLNLPLLIQYEHTFSQIALSDNPHIDMVAKILVKLESINNDNNNITIINNDSL